jgi:hypothetical protein
MFTTTKTARRFAIVLASAAAIVALAASASAFAGGRVDGRSPDTKDAALAVHARGQLLIDGRSPDTRDAALPAHADDQALVDGRSPDTRDFAALAHEPVVTVSQTPGFQWGDFGIGVAAAIAVVVAVVLSMLLFRRQSQQPDTVATV